MRDTKKLEAFSIEKQKEEKQKSLFKNLRKEVETGANGTQDYIIKKGINKGKKANGWGIELLISPGWDQTTIEEYYEGEWKNGKRDGYGETEFASYLAQKTGKDPEDLYFDGNDLVYGSKIIVRGANRQTVDKLLAKLKTIRSQNE